MPVRCRTPGARSRPGRSWSITVSRVCELSPYAERLARVMTGPPTDDARFVGEPVDLRRVSDRELGALLALAWQIDEDLDPASRAVATAVQVRYAVRDRS